MPPSGATARLVNGHLSLAVVLMKARSAKPRMVAPMPRPSPFTAITRGLGKATSASMSPRKPCSPSTNPSGSMHP
jgi:hypothetical protein